ncbi:hypothetical protein CAAN1_16S03994 [[Candida] anglica]|uniref:Uncharacterized protein n=1 Tax=[Candida] anglica TaxID=148631 RepID=A0ABP0E9X4_9ASCO
MKSSTVLVHLSNTLLFVNAIHTQLKPRKDGTISDCHFHGSSQFCIDSNGVEGSIIPPPTSEDSAPQSYSGCHVHGSDTFCLTENGDEVQFMVESTDTQTSTSSTPTTAGKKNCHFHAGVEHCVEDGHNEHNDVEGACERTDREYNIHLRIGLLFAILVTSGIGVFSPLLLNKVLNIDSNHIILIIFSQFGTGVIISTAFVHLMTHANLMWSNSCIKGNSYESTGSAITMAGIFISFLFDYLIHSTKMWRDNKSQIDSHDEESKNFKNSPESSIDNLPRENDSPDNISVFLLEAGIIFHSILIGITLVVAGDSFFITLFIVILFHQMFEGLALGSRLTKLVNISFLWKSTMAILFSIITPIGMAIGIGVLHKFNGNDSSTLIALGTLDSFSAGILVYTGLVNMLAEDWKYGNLSNTKPWRVGVALLSLVSGMILMSVLGKWA